MPARPGLSRLLLSRLWTLLALTFLRPRCATGVLHARLAPLLAGLLLVVGLTRLVLVRVVATRLLTGILPRRLLRLGIGGTG